MADASGNIVVESRVKVELQSLGMRSTGEIADALDKQVRAILKRAAERAKLNGRQTVQKQDL